MPRTSGKARTRPPTCASSRSSPPRRPRPSTGSRSPASSSRGRTAATGSPAAAARAASGFSRSATAPGMRSRRPCARPSRARPPRPSRTRPSPTSNPTSSGWRARCGEHVIEAGAVILAAGGRCFREAEERGELSTNHPGATGEVTRIALDLGAEARDLDALQYHPNGGAWPENMQGYSIPETTRAYGAVLLNADRAEFTDSLGPRDEVSQAIVDEVANGGGVETPDGRPAVWLDTTRISRGGRRGFAPVHAAPLPRGRHRPAPRAAPHLSRSSTTRTAAS